MPMQVSTYDQVRDRLRPGDVIAFRGESALSRFIRLAAGSDVSHVGVILEARAPGKEPRLVEATVRFGLKDPTFHVERDSFRGQYAGYYGAGWWLPLAPAVRAALDDRDLWQRFTGSEQQRDVETYFCSELVARALESAGAVGKVVAAQVSPADLCRWRLFDDTYHFLPKPNWPHATDIHGYNTRPPGST